MVRCFAALSIRSAEAVITTVSARWAEEDGAGADARKGAGAEFETISGVCFFFLDLFFLFFPLLFSSCVKREQTTGGGGMTVSPD